MNALKTLALALGLTLVSGAVLVDDAQARPNRDRYGEYQRPAPRKVFAPVRVINDRNQFVSVFVDGRFLANIAPRSRAVVELPLGFHNLTYKVGHRNTYRTVSVRVTPHGQNRVIIPAGRMARPDHVRVGWW